MVRKYFLRGKDMAKLDADKLIKELNNKWGGKACPFCGGSWTASSKIFELREYCDGDILLGAGPITPVVPITCDNCGNTVLVNPLVLKVVEK